MKLVAAGSRKLQLAGLDSKIIKSLLYVFAQPKVRGYRKQ